MSSINWLPPVVLRRIIDHAIDYNVESLERWKQCLHIKNVCLKWRRLLKDDLMSTVIFELETLPNGCILGQTNYPFIEKLGCEEAVKTVAIYAPHLVQSGSENDAIYSTIPRVIHELTGRHSTNLCLAPSSSSFSCISTRVCTIIDPVSRMFPNLLQIMLHTIDVRPVEKYGKVHTLEYDVSNSLEFYELPCVEGHGYVSRVCIASTALKPPLLKRISEHDTPEDSLAKAMRFRRGSSGILYRQRVPYLLGDERKQDVICEAKRLTTNRENMVEPPDIETVLLYYVPQVKFVTSRNEVAYFDIFAASKRYERVMLSSFASGSTC